VNGRSCKIQAPDLINILKCYDIILLQETWLHKNSNSNLDITGNLSDHVRGLFQNFIDGSFLTPIDNNHTQYR
jgi:hypothetical protein